MTTVAGYIHSKLQSQVVDLLIPRVIKYMQTKNVTVTTQELYRAIGINIPAPETKIYSQPNILFTPAPAPVYGNNPLQIQFGAYAQPNTNISQSQPQLNTNTSYAQQPNTNIPQSEVKVSAQGIIAKVWKDGLLRETKHGFILKPQTGDPAYMCIGISPDENIMRPLSIPEEITALEMKIPLVTAAMSSLKKVQVNGHSVTTETPPGQPVSTLMKVAT